MLSAGELECILILVQRAGAVLPDKGVEHW